MPFAAAVRANLSAAERLAGASNAAVSGAVECGVKTAYAVIDEYMRRGRETARQSRQHPDGGSTMNDDRYNSGNWSAAWGPAAPLVAPWMEMMRVWTSAMSGFAPGADGRGGWPAGSAPASSTSAPPSSAAPRVSVRVSSSRPTEVAAVVLRYDPCWQIIAEPLRHTVHADTLALDGVVVSCEPGQVRVSLTVATQHPTGRYVGRLLTADRHEQVGNLTVDVFAPAD